MKAGESVETFGIAPSTALTTSYLPGIRHATPCLRSGYKELSDGTTLKPNRLMVRKIR